MRPSAPRVTDALKFGGYRNFFRRSAPLPAIGTIAFEARTVEVRYAREEPHEKGIRLVLVADRPLFFLGDPVKPRAGYELTMVELILDAKGAGTNRRGSRKADARGGIVVDEFEVAPVQLTVRRFRKNNAGCRVRETAASRTIGRRARRPASPTWPAFGWR